MSKMASNTHQHTFNARIVGHPPIGRSQSYYLRCRSPVSTKGPVCTDFATQAANNIQSSHDRECRCGAKVDVKQLYSVLMLASDRRLRHFGTRLYPLPHTAIHITGSYDVGITQRFSPAHIDLVIYILPSVKRKASAEASKPSGSGKHLRKHAPRIPRAVQSPDAERPMYVIDSITTNEPLLDLVEQLQFGAGFFDDHTQSIRYCFEFTSESTWGFFTPAVSHRDSIRFVKTLGSVLDRTHAAIFEEIFGRFKFYQWATTHCAHSKDFILEIDLRLAKLVISSSANAQTLLKIILKAMKASVTSFLKRYSTDFPLTIQEGGEDGVLERLLTYFEDNRGEFDRKSTIVVIVLGYDELMRRAHIESLTGSPLHSTFPSVEDVSLLFLETLYIPVYTAREKNIVSKVLLQGYSATFLIEYLTIVPNYALMYDRPQIVGGIGYTRAQIRDLAIGLHGPDLSVEVLAMLQKFDSRLPRYCPSYSTSAVPQIPRKFVHAVLPALHHINTEELSTALYEVIDRDMLDHKTHQLLTTLAGRGMSGWRAEADKLMLDGKTPVAETQYRYSYADVPPDKSASGGLKQGAVPNFQIFTSACSEAGMLTFSPEVVKHFVFPNRATRLKLDMDVLQPIVNKEVMIPPPFDGSPGWIDTVFTPYLRKSRTVYSVFQSSENEMQSALHQKLDTSLVVGGGIANHVALEVKTLDRRRIDILATSLAMLCIIELKNIPLVALYEATMGVTLERTANGKDLTEASIILVERFFKHIHNLPTSVWTESPFNPNYQKLTAPTTPRTSFPTTLDEFFYHGWCNKVKGTFSIYALWASADGQGSGYATELNTSVLPLDDERFERHVLGYNDENGEAICGEIHVLVVIVIAGICVLARRAKQYAKPKKTQNVIFPVSKKDH